MTEFIVDTGKKKYIVKANDAEHAVELVKKIDDSQREARVQRLKTPREGYSWTVQYESRPYMYNLEFFKSKDEALSWAKSKRFNITRVDDEDSTKDADITELSNNTKKAYAEVKKLKKGTSEYSKALKKWENLHRELTKATYSGNTSRKIGFDDEASQLQTVNALIEDEKAAVEAYNVAIENLRGKIPEESLQVLITTRDDENRHIENLQTVVNGTVTEKNLEDSMMNDGLRLEEIESQLIKAQKEAKNKQWSNVAMRCEDIIAAINQKR